MLFLNISCLTQIMHLTMVRLNKRLRFTTQRGFIYSPLWCLSKLGLTLSKCNSSTLSRFLLHNSGLTLSAITIIRILGFLF